MSFPVRYLFFLSKCLKSFMKKCLKSFMKMRNTSRETVEIPNEILEQFSNAASY